jgi:hypothetical protein
VGDWLVGKSMEGLLDVTKGGALKEFRRSVVPDDAKQSADAFKIFFREQFNKVVRDPIVEKFGQFLLKKGEVGLYSSRWVATCATL